MPKRPLKLLCLLLLLAASPVPAEGTASLTLLFTNNGEPLDDPLHAKFYLYEPGKREEYVAWGHGAKSAIFPEGEYDLVIRFEYGEVKREIVREEVELVGDTIEEIDFQLPIAHLTVDVTTGGRPIDPFAGNYAVYPAGQRGTPLARLRPGEQLTIRPGNYDIEVSYRDLEGMKRSTLEQYHLEGARHETVELGLPQVQLRLTLLENGRALDNDAGLWRVYRAGQRRGPLVERGSGEPARLDAGFYDIVALRRGGGSGGERWLVNYDVRGDRDDRVELGIPRSRLRIDVTRNGDPAPDAWFAVYPAGNRDAAIASAASGEEVQVETGTYDIGCFLRQGGARAERWVDARAVREDTRLEVELDLHPASLRVLPRVARRGAEGSPSRLNLVVDSSVNMRARARGESRMAMVRAAVRTVADELAPADVGVGLRVFGGGLESRSCLDTESLVPPQGLEPDSLAAALEAVEPVGAAPLAYALQQAVGDLRGGWGNFLVLITSSLDGCGGDPCQTATRLLRQGGVDGIYVIGFDVDRDQRRRLDCIGSYFGADNAEQLADVLRGIVRETSRWSDGTLSVFTTDRPGTWIASGFLGDEIRLAAGTYDVLIHSEGKTYSWDGVAVQGNLKAVAGRRAPR